MPLHMVLATATLFCRPLRFLFDVEQSVAVLRHDAGEKDEAVLGHVHVHLSISVLPDDEPTHCTEEISSQQHDELSDVLGRFVSVRVRLQLPPDSDKIRRWRVQYQLSPATESFLLPADHTNVFRVLVTEALVAWVATTALVFSFLPPKQRHEEEKEEGDGGEKLSPVERTPPPVTISTPHVLTEEAEATRRLTEAAASAAHEAAEAAREAARAATHAMEAAKTLHQEHGQIQQQQQLKYERERERERELEAERQRAHVRLDADAKENAREAEHVLAQQQLQHKMERLSDEKQQLRDGAERLKRELQEKDVAMEQWTQQTATTAAAIELLKQRVDADAREREELQRRLRVLEAEKLELQRKSRACVVQ